MGYLAHTLVTEDALADAVVLAADRHILVVDLDLRDGVYFVFDDVEGVDLAVVGDVGVLGPIGLGRDVDGG